MAIFNIQGIDKLRAKRNELIEQQTIELEKAADKSPDKLPDKSDEQKTREREQVRKDLHRATHTPTTEQRRSNAERRYQSRRGF